MQCWLLQGLFLNSSRFLSLETDGKELAEARIAGAGRGEQDALAVGGPRQHRIRIGVPGEPLGNAPGGGHHEHVDVAVVFAGEGNLRAVGREYGIDLDPGPVVSRLASPPSRGTLQRSPA